jgi:glycosyltransferase involved in cell wall biosynthesis
MFDNMPETFADSRKVGLNHIGVRLLRLEEKLSVLLADRVIACQKTCREMLRSRGTPESKISVVLNVPDEDVFNRNIPSGKDNGVFRLITHGTLVERYNVQSLIKAVPLLIRDIPELEVNVVGDGEYRPQLEELARSLSVHNYINFTGRVPFDEVFMHIARADVGVVVIPAGANPALPHKLFEYMALGKPVVVTTIPTITAYFDDNLMLFYEPDNSPDMARCILELYRNPAKRAAMAAAVVAAYQQYHWPVMKDEYIKVFERLGEHPPKVAG